MGSSPLWNTGIVRPKSDWENSGCCTDKLLKEVLMIDCLSIVETDKVNHAVEIESFGMSSDEFDKETGSSDGLQPKQADLNCVHALN
ncbi:hypothetical protein Tco_0336700 [Tanacetum coccineum]